MSPAWAAVLLTAIFTALVVWFGAWLDRDREQGDDE